MSQSERIENRYWDLVEAAPDGILEVDAEGKIILSNRVAAAMFGYDRDEMIGTSIEQLVPNRYRQVHVKDRERYHGHLHTRPMGSGLALSGLRRDGSEFPVEISLSPADYGDGIKVIAVIRDVTERRAAEDKIKIVQEQYTTELADKNRELALRNQEIEKANRLKSEFLASMSHELRTPLHTIIGFSELLSEEIEGPLSPKQKRFVSHIRQDSQHLLELINDILDLSKIEAGRLELRLEEFDMGQAIDEVISSIQLRATEKEQKLDVSVLSQFLIYADRVRFKEILYNLLSNAVKFTPEHGVISVQCETERDMLIVSVRDTGIGISAEEHASIFDKFHQVGSTTKGVREGTGLGLAITKRLVELHCGSITVESERDKGALFTVRMPVDIRLGGRQKTLGRERPLVLIVEDEPGASELLMNYLANSQFDTAAAANAGEALKLALDLLPDAITLDLLIPGGKGWKVLSEIRRHPETSRTPVIVVSVLEERERAMQMGAAEYLMKPVSRDVLVAAVERNIHATYSHRG